MPERRSRKGKGKTRMQAEAKESAAMVRKVYLFPPEMLEAVRRFRFAEEHGSEGEAVREIMKLGLKTYERTRQRKKKPSGADDDA
jgi:hypothetical protein